MNSSIVEKVNVGELSKLFHVAKGENRNIDKFLVDCGCPEDKYERNIIVDIFRGNYNEGLQFYHLMNVARASQKRVSIGDLTVVAGINYQEQINSLRNVEVIRGGIYWCDLGITVDSVQGGKRPVLVIQNNVGNTKSSTTLVVPLTSRTTKTMLPTHVEFSSESGLPSKSIGLFEQIQTVSKRQFLTNGYPENIGFVPKQKMLKEVNAAICVSFELNKINEEYNIQVVKEYLLALEGVQEAKLIKRTEGLDSAEKVLMNDLTDYVKRCGKNIQEEITDTFVYRLLKPQYVR